MDDISFSTKVQNLLSESAGNKGVIYTDNGKIVMIEAEQV